MSRPDAVFLPASIKPAGRLAQRIDAVATIAERWLEIAAGERVYIRKQPHGRMFVTRDPHDTILFPTGHARSSTPRYRWERRDDGIEVGYLLERN